MTIDIDPTKIPVITHGHVRDEHRAYAAEKVHQVLHEAGGPVLFVEIKLTQQRDPARPRPSEAEAVIDVNGEPIRAHVAAGVMTEAIDLLEGRLRRRITRRAEIREDRQRARAGARADVTSWRHGEHATERPDYFDRPVDDREIIRRKTFAVGELTPDEAADLLDLLGHDFLLFSNLVTGADAVVHYAAEGGVELIDSSGRADALGGDTVAPIVLSNRGVPELALAEAEEQLDLDVLPFVFFTDAETGRGAVAYRRYDGHYGLISPA